MHRPSGDLASALDEADDVKTEATVGADEPALIDAVSAAGGGVTADARIGRVRATLVAVVFNYLLAVVSIVKQLVLVPFYLHFIDFKTYSSWLATGNVLALLGIVEG